MKFKYLEVISYNNKEVVSRLDVSSLSERRVDKLERGININLNHDYYYTAEKNSEVKLLEL